MVLELTAFGRKFVVAYGKTIEVEEESFVYNTGGDFSPPSGDIVIVVENDEQDRAFGFRG